MKESENEQPKNAGFPGAKGQQSDEQRQGQAQTRLTGCLNLFARKKSNQPAAAKRERKAVRATRDIVNRRAVNRMHNPKKRAQKGRVFQSYRLHAWQIESAGRDNAEGRRSRTPLPA